MTTDMTHRSGRSPYEVEHEGAIFGLWDEDQIMVLEAYRHFLLEHHNRPEFPEFGGLDHETDFRLPMKLKRTVSTRTQAASCYGRKCLANRNARVRSKTPTTRPMRARV